MGSYIANRIVTINGTVYDEGDQIPSSELMPWYFKNLVRRGHVSDTEISEAAGKWGMWSGTQAEYDALASYDDTILYVITE